MFLIGFNIMLLVLLRRSVGSMGLLVAGLAWSILTNTDVFAGGLAAVHRLPDAASHAPEMQPLQDASQTSIDLMITGDILLEAGNAESAQSVFERALRMREQAAASFPREVAIWSDVAAAQSRLVDALLVMEDTSAALEASRAVLATLHRISALEPDDPGHRLAIATATGRVADILIHRGEFDQAASEIAVACNVLEPIAELAPLLRYELARFLRRQGELQVRLGRRDIAWDRFASGHRIVLELVAGSPGERTFAYELEMLRWRQERLAR